MTFFDLKARYVIIKFKFLLTKRELSLVSNYKMLKNLENNDFLKKYQYCGHKSKKWPPKVEKNGPVSVQGGGVM